MANFLIVLARFLSLALYLLWWLILIRALISWVNPDPYNLIVQFLYRVTEPILSPIRKVLPLRLSTGIDISPLIAFLAIFILRSFFVPLLVDLAYRII